MTAFMSAGVKAAAFAAFVRVFMSAFVHANLNWTLGPFRYVLASPVFHRWHHTALERGGAEAAVPHEQSRIERTLRDAGGFLLLELAWLLYALVAVGPIVLLAAVAVYVVRAGRRRSDARLLEGA